MSQNQNPFDDFVNVDYASLSDWIFSFTGTEYAIVGALLGILIASPLNINQQNSIGNFLELIGQTILAINAQEINRRTKNSSGVGYQNTNQDIIFRLHKLEEELNKMKKTG